MTSETLDLKGFVNQVQNFYTKSHSEKILIFGYYLQKKKNIPCFTIGDIKNCYTLTAIKQPQNFSDFFIKLTKSGKLVPQNDCYVVSAIEELRIENDMLGLLPIISLKKDLRELPKQFPLLQEKFVNEILGCIQVQAWRGAIVLSWLLTMDHLQRIVLSNYLDKFNEIIHETQLYKKLTILKIEDFEEIKDFDFLLTIRTCGMISGSQFNILETRLKERNRYAHPTNLEITDTMVTSFVEDLLYNIVNKVNRSNNS